MFLILGFLFYRVKEPIGEISYIPKLHNKKELNSFLESNKNAAIIFSPPKDNSELNFMNYPISVFKKKLKFAISDPEFANQFNTPVSHNKTTVIGFISGKPVYFNNDPKTPIELTPFQIATYFDYLLGLRTKKIHTPEELRQILNGNRVAVIGVENVPKPANFPPNEIFYESSVSFFWHFKINITGGIYVYRPADRQLIRANNNYKVYTKTFITDINNLLRDDLTELKQKKYIAGYYASSNNQTLSTHESKILNEIAKNKDYSNDFYFSFFPRSPDNLLYVNGRFNYFTSPFFVVVETSFLAENTPQSFENAKRWIIINENQSHDLNYILDFLDRIRNEQEKAPVLISEELKEDDVQTNLSIPISMKLTYGKFGTLTKSLKDSKKDNFVVFIKKGCARYNRIILTIKILQRMLESHNLQLSVFDVSKNDLPDSVYQIINHEFGIKNGIIDIPFMIQFPYSNDQPSSRFYHGMFIFDEMIDWISHFASDPFETPQYDSDAIRTEIFESDPDTVQLNTPTPIPTPDVSKLDL